MPGAEATVSALLPVHAGVRPDHLRSALHGLLEQTRLPDEVVVVHDGPLLPEQRELLDWLDEQHPRVVQVELPTNRGAGIANQAGLAGATCEWIAKFDADDICLPTRIEHQIRALLRSGADVCGSAMLEFDTDPDLPVALRANPTDHPAIARRMRFNNPINHPSATYRRQLALQVGGYADLRYMQDYDLFARMLVAGARMLNLPEALVLFRADDEMRRRRKARDLLRLEWRLQRRLRSYGLVNVPRLVANLTLRAAFRMLPQPLLRAVYRTLLSRPLRRPPAESKADDGVPEVLRSLVEGARARVWGIGLVPLLMWRNRWSRSPVVAPDTDVTVCLTSYGKRLAHVHLVIESIARGRVRPGRLVLWLAHVEAEGPLPPGLQRLQRRGLEILACDDFGSHKKYYPFTVEADPRASLVTADDDVFYPARWLHGLVQAKDQDAAAVWCYRARRLLLDHEAPGPYRSWPLWVGSGPSPLMVPTGVSGILHPPELMAEVRRQGDAFLSLAPRADDLWLHALAVAGGIRIRQVGRRNWHFPVSPTAGGQALMTRNVGRGNDEVVARLYGRDVMLRLRSSVHGRS